VKDKATALREFHRVLKPRAQCFWYDVEPVAALWARIRSLLDAMQDLESDPMLDFDEQDLVAHAELAGFGE